MRGTMYNALLLTILQGASALQLRPRTRTQSTVLSNNYLDKISGADAAAASASASFDAASPPPEEIWSR